MDDLNTDRRAILKSAGALAALAAAMRYATSGGIAWAADAGGNYEAFSADRVQTLAKSLASSSFARPKVNLSDRFKKLTYDQYRDIRFRTDKSIWRGQGLSFELQPFPMGWLYEAPVELWTVEDGLARSLSAGPELFTFGPLVGKAPAPGEFGFSGFRIHGPINRPDYFDEYALFQGASYFRAVGRGHLYGLSARGLALNTAKPGGEEFPLFRAFWIEKPAKDDKLIVVHALLDSPSTTGAFKFSIAPGNATVMDIEATLYPRRELATAGIAPLTSMFLLGPHSKAGLDDFRPAVHDSEGLAILNGNGERLWRPLCNPKTLQRSAFMDRNPIGFGLMQRDRSFENYQDLEARYERRPSLWVEPRGDWGHGAVELIEIPTREEIHDNIVAFWRPAQPLPAGKPFRLAYRLHWGSEIPATWAPAIAVKTRIGMKKAKGKDSTNLMVIDFAGPALDGLDALPKTELKTTAGVLGNIVVQKNPSLPGVRVSFEFDPGSSKVAELRLELRASEKPISEKWLHRWTAT